jgi:hypothetical protein
VVKGFPGSRLVFPRAATLASLASERKDFIPGEKMEPIYLRETKFVKAPPPRKIPFFHLTGWKIILSLLLFSIHNSPG